MRPGDCISSRARFSRLSSGSFGSARALNAGDRLTLGSAAASSAVTSSVGVLDLAAFVFWGAFFFDLTVFVTAFGARFFTGASAMATSALREARFFLTGDVAE